MLSKKSRLVSACITYSAIPVGVAVSLTFTVRAIPIDIGQMGARIKAVIIFEKTCSDTTRYILSSISLITNKRTLENVKREAER
jgi:hypothetical protein